MDPCGGQLDSMLDMNNCGDWCAPLGGSGWGLVSSVQRRPNVGRVSSCSGRFTDGINYPAGMGVYWQASAPR